MFENLSFSLHMNKQRREPNYIFNLTPTFIITIQIAKTTKDLRLVVQPNNSIELNQVMKLGLQPARNRPSNHQSLVLWNWMIQIQIQPSHLPENDPVCSRVPTKLMFHRESLPPVRRRRRFGQINHRVFCFCFTKVFTNYIFVGFQQRDVSPIERCDPVEKSPPAATRSTRDSVSKKSVGRAETPVAASGKLQ